MYMCACIYICIYVCIHTYIYEFDEIDDELRPNGKLWNYLGVYVYSI
jgi:hypothetical protein